MANAVGRPIAPLVLSPDERAYLERQVRRYRVARPLYAGGSGIGIICSACFLARHSSRLCRF